MFPMQMFKPNTISFFFGRFFFLISVVFALQHLHKRRLEESHERRRKKRQSEGKAVAPPRKLQVQYGTGWYSIVWKSVVRWRW